MGDDASRRNHKKEGENSNPFSFVSFLKHKKADNSNVSELQTDGDLPVVSDLESLSTTPSEIQAKDVFESPTLTPEYTTPQPNPFSIKNFGALSPGDVVHLPLLPPQGSKFKSKEVELPVFYSDDVALELTLDPTSDLGIDSAKDGLNLDDVVLLPILPLQSTSTRPTKHKHRDLELPEFDTADVGPESAFSPVSHFAIDPADDIQLSVFDSEELVPNPFSLSNLDPSLIRVDLPIIPVDIFDGDGEQHPAPVDRKRRDDSLRLQQMEKRLRKCELENAELQERLMGSEKVTLEKDLRLESLTAEIERMKLKEAEDTKTLEQMMQSVEKNLEITTTRAVAAENMVSKLKSELKTLQSHVSSLEEQLSASVNEASVAGRAQTIANKMSHAANQAETSLKDLLEGVGQLRLLSSVLGDLTNVSEAS